MARMKDRLEDIDARVAVIGFEDSNRLGWLREKIDSPFPFLRDPELAAYEAYGLGRAAWARTYLHPDVVGGYARMVVKGQLPDLHLGQDRRRLGGDFAIDTEGRIALAHPERGPEDRAAVSELVGALRRAVSSD